MALPFPNVPNLPGVPPVPRLPGVAVSAGLTIASGAISALLGQSAQKQNLWGIFDSTMTPVLDPDSVLEFSHRKQRSVSDFPIVKGSFASYNKIDLPFEIQVRISKGSRSADRKTLLNQLQALVESIDLYTIVTPEQKYENCNLEHYEVARTSAKDAYFLTQVDLTFIQIIQSTAQYTNTPVNTSNAQSSAALPVTNQGTVQPQTPSGNVASLGQSALNAAAANPGTW